jgi:hypothetical protein
MGLRPSLGSFAVFSISSSSHLFPSYTPASRTTLVATLSFPGSRRRIRARAGTPWRNRPIRESPATWRLTRVAKRGPHPLDMAVRPSNPALRGLVLVGIVAVSALLGFLGCRHAIAEHWANSDNPDQWLRAARWEPANAESWYRLGRYRQLDFENSDLPQATYQGLGSDQREGKRVESIAPFLSQS